jgi:hypothetical protein
MKNSMEPVHLGHEDAAAFLAISPRLLDQFVRERTISPIRIPGVRRIVYLVRELRELSERWAAERAS